MSISQLSITGRLVAAEYALHCQDAICVLLPDEIISNRFGENALMDYDQICNRSLNPFEYSRHGRWIDTRILYDHSQSRWYLENFPFLQVIGLFVRR